jgi:hypothetical protein
MVAGTFGDNLLGIENEITKFGFLALVIIGFALAYDGIQRLKSE